MRVHCVRMVIWVRCGSTQPASRVGKRAYIPYPGQVQRQSERRARLRARGDLETQHRTRAISPVHLVGKKKSVKASEAAAQEANRVFKSGDMSLCRQLHRAHLVHTSSPLASLHAAGHWLRLPLQTRAHWLVRPATQRRG
jgi:hypothetical protein